MTRKLSSAGKAKPRKPVTSKPWLIASIPKEVHEIITSALESRRLSHTGYRDDQLLVRMLADVMEALPNAFGQEGYSAWRKVLEERWPTKDEEKSLINGTPFPDQLYLTEEAADVRHSRNTETLDVSFDLSYLRHHDEEVVGVYKFVEKRLVTVRPVVELTRLVK